MWVGRQIAQVTVQVDVESTIPPCHEAAKIIVAGPEVRVLLEQEGLQIAPHRPTLKAVQLLHVFSVVGQAVLPLHPPVRERRVGCLQDRAFYLPDRIIARIGVERIVADVGVEVRGGPTDIEGHDVAQSLFVAVSLRQQVDASERRAWRGDERRAHILLDHVEAFASDDDRLEQLADRLVHGLDVKGVDLRHHVGREANIHPFAPVDALDLVADILIAGVDHRHAVAGVGGRLRELGQQARVVQLRFRVATEVDATCLKNDLRLVLLVDGLRLLWCELAVVAGEQLGPGGESRQIGGEAALIRGQGHGDHLEPALRARTGQLDVELLHRAPQRSPTLLPLTRIHDAQAVRQR